MATRIKPSLTTSEILDIIQRNASIADVSNYQLLVKSLTFGLSPLLHQQATMQKHWVFLELLVENAPDLWLLLNFAREKLYTSFFPTTRPLQRFFKALFVEEALWERWIAYLDGLAEDISQEQLKLLNFDSLLVARPARKRLVIVGDGPLGTMLASVFSAYFEVTLVTEQRRLGNQWRSRKMHLNSTCTIRSLDGAPLPLEAGPTTRLLARPVDGEPLGLDVDVLALRDALEVPCEVGSVIYPSGPLFGELIAHNLHIHVDTFITRQWVDISRISRTADDAVRLVLRDIDTNTERELEADVVLFATGPGPEASQVRDVTSRQVYQQATENLDRLLRETRFYLSQERKLLDLYAMEYPEEFAAQRARTCERVTGQARYLQSRLPLIWTLTAVQKVYALWQELEEFGVPADAFPLAPLFDSSLSVGYAGAGDTTKTLKACMDGTGPASAYPRGLYPQGHRRSTIYNLPASTASEYQEQTRRRYWGVFTGQTRALPCKVAGYRLVFDARKGRQLVEVVHFDDAGNRCCRRYDYLFDSTGLDRTGIEALLPAQFQMQTIADLEGKPVARGDMTGRLFIVGSATGSFAPAFSPEIKAILEALGIGENTVALWVKGVDTERLAYTYVCLIFLALRARLL